MRPIKLILLIITLVGPASAGTLFNDTTDFTSWNGQGGIAPRQLNKWGSNLPITGASNTIYGLVGRTFDRTSLKIGETIELSFDWQQLWAPVNNLSVGIFDRSAGPSTGEGIWFPGSGSFSGYYSYVSDYNFYQGNKANMALLQNSAPVSYDSFPLGNPSTVISPANTSAYGINYSYNNNATYRVNYSITRNAESSISTYLIIKTGNTEVARAKGTSNAPSTLSLNCVTIATGDPTTGTAILDNITLKLIPAPALKIIRNGSTASISAENLVVNRTYQLQTSTDLQNWSNYNSAFVAASETLQLPGNWSVGVGSKIFFRLTSID